MAQVPGPRLTPAGSVSSSSSATIHFGVRVAPGRVHGLRIDRATYAQINKRSSTTARRELYSDELWHALSPKFEDDEHRFHTDEWCAEQQADALENFDLNMAYFAQLDQAEFEAAVEAVVQKRKTRWLREVTDLKKWDGRAGAYVMVLDGHRQVYVGVTGVSTGVMKRIRQHWSTSKPFDRLLWGGVEDSIISIDSFRALDTTRIFAYEKADAELVENDIINALPSKFVLNRTVGGGGRMVGLLAAFGGDIVKRRALVGGPGKDDSAEMPAV